MNRIWLAFAVLVALAQVPAQAALNGTVKIDGSSTVFPISAAVAEEFNRTKDYRNVKVTVAYSGTGGGFKKWCLGETDINDASRKIKDKEKKCAAEHGISYLEIPVAYDGITVVASKKNKFFDSLTMDQLKKLWEPGSKVNKWSQLNPKWPNEEIKLYGPGAESGTFDYFTKAVNGKERASRSDYTASEDDNVLVKGVAASPHALGYFGYAYYVENKNSLKSVSLDDGKGAVAPTNETIENTTYPLARPVFVYVSSKSVQKPEVQAFMRYYIENAGQLSKAAGYTPLSDAAYKKQLKAFNDFVTQSKPKG